MKSELAEKINKYFQKEKRDITYCLLVTVFFGLLAHGYVLMQDAFSHDSLNAFYSGARENSWMISLGRFLVPVYRAVFRGSVAIPWLIGAMSFLWVGLSGYLITKMFLIKSRFLQALVMCILITNSTVTAWAGTYIFLMDITLFGVLMGVIAAFVWRKYRFGYVWGIPFVVLALGLYQSNISVVITLLMLLSIWDILNNAQLKAILINGVRGIGMILVGGGLYALGNKLVQSLTGIEPAQTYNSLSQITDTSVSILDRVKYVFFHPIAAYLRPISYLNSWLMTILGLIIVLLSAVLLICVLRKNKLPLKSVAVGLALLVLLPFGMNTSALLMGNAHGLMLFQVWYALLFIVALFDQVLPQFQLKRADLVKGIGYFLVICLLWNNVVVSNTLYIKKDLEKEGTISKMTRVVARMEEIPEYSPGVTPVAFVGKPGENTMPGFEQVSSFAGSYSSSPITGINVDNSFNTYEAFFYYYLNEPIAFCEEGKRQEFLGDVRVKDMPLFPLEGSIQVLDGVVVVKISEEKPD